MADRFFGYGSLVNAATHIYPDTRPDSLSGWQRGWVATAGRDIAFLSVVPAPGEIEGLTAAVPGGDWAALDLRETGYDRHAVQTQAGQAVQVYAVPDVAAGLHHPILLSYLDVVIQGFLQVFGEAGAARFFTTTQGWETRVLDDRPAPRYPRAQALSAAETAFVDHHLAQTAATLRPA